MVFIQVFKVGAVVYPVVRRRVQHKLQWLWQPVDHFGMNPKLVDQTDLLHQQDPKRVKPQQGQPGPEQESTGGIARPGLPERRGQVVMLRRMVHHMRSPEPVDIVSGSVEPVVCKILGKKQEYPIPPNCVIKVEDPELVKEQKEAKDQCLGNKTNNDITDSKGKAAQGIQLFVQVPVLPVREPGFYRQ